MSVTKIKNAPVQNGAAMVEILFDFLQREGVDKDIYLATLPFKFAAESADTLDFSELEQLLLHAMQCLDDDGFVLRYGQQLSVAALGTLGYALLCCSNLAQVLDLLCCYQRLLSPVLTVRTEPNDDYVLLALGGSVEVPPIEVELFFSTAAAFLYQFFGRDRVNIKLQFTYPQPKHLASYRAVFGEALAFETEVSAMQIGNDVLTEPMQFANPAMLKRYQQQCDELLKSAQMAHYTTRVQRLLLSRPGNFPSFEQAADALHIGTRTLRRRLLDEGKTYKQIVQDVRRAIAEKYLSQSLMSIAEVSEMLGYTDVANFRRAFISWTGVSPAKFRLQKKQTREH